jgi:hypothetical protein
MSTTVSYKTFLEGTIGHQGRMIAGSKSGYRSAYPKNVPVFNSNLVIMTADGPEKIWCGDVDLTLDHEKLIQLSKDLNAEVYILREYDGRFENENTPLIENYVAMYSHSRKEPVVINRMHAEYYALEGNQIVQKNP